MTISLQKIFKTQDKQTAEIEKLQKIRQRENEFEFRAGKCERFY
jgi:hypothetical protein